MEHIIEVYPIAFSYLQYLTCKCILYIIIINIICYSVSGGTSSIVFEANEAAKEIGIPIYNDPNYQGQLTFKVVLKSTPGGPKIGDIGSADVVITCVQMGELKF